MADRLLIIKEGQLEQIGPPQTCYLEPATPWVAGLLGAINRTTSVQDINNDRVYSVGPQIVQALNPFPDVRFPVGQRVELRSPPEDIELYEQEPELPPHYSVNRPIVLDSSFEGKYWRVTLCNEPDILYYALHEKYIEPGTQVWAVVTSDKLFVYPIADDQQ